MVPLAATLVHGTTDPLPEELLHTPHVPLTGPPSLPTPWEPFKTSYLFLALFLLKLSSDVLSCSEKTPDASAVSLGLGWSSLACLPDPPSVWQRSHTASLPLLGTSSGRLCICLPSPFPVAWSALPLDFAHLFPPSVLPQKLCLITLFLHSSHCHARALY